MKTSMTALVAVFTIGSIGLASSASACHGGFGGYSSYSYDRPVEVVRNVYVESAPTFAPGHSIIVVLPGDSWFSISSREYGNTSVWSRIAEFNGLPQNLPLTVGMQLRLPVINPNGGLSMSNAPAMIAQGFNGGFNGGFQGQPQGFQPGMQQGNLPQGFAQGGMPQGAQFGQSNGMPQGGQFGQPNGQPQGGQFAQPNGQPQGNGFAPQGQGFAPQQGQMGMQQGNLPQGGPFAPQGQQFAPQGNVPQGQPLGAQGGMPQGPQAAAPQGPMNAPQAGGQFAPQAPVEAPQVDAVGQIVAKVGEIAGQAIANPPQLNAAPAAAPNAAPAAAPNARPLPSIVIGSLMSIGGQQLGNDRGMVHLNVNGTTRMLEIVEWTASAAKVKIPADLPAGIQAELEIIRADGSIVTKDQVQLAAGQQLAGN
jgi:hypothetical protein